MLNCRREQPSSYHSSITFEKGTLSLTQPQTCTARYKSLQKKKSPRRLVGNLAQYYGHWLADWASNWHDPAQCSSWRSPAFCKSKGTIASQFSFFPSSLFHIRSDTPQLTCLYHISTGCKIQQPVKSFFFSKFFNLQILLSFSCYSWTEYDKTKILNEESSQRALTGDCVGTGGLLVGSDQPTDRTTSSESFETLRWAVTPIHLIP